MIYYSVFNDNVDLISHRELGNTAYAIDILKANPELAGHGMVLPLRTKIVLPKVKETTPIKQSLTKIF